MYDHALTTIQFGLTEAIVGFRIPVSMASHIVKSIYTAIQCGYMHTPNIVACTCIYTHAHHSYIIWTTENINVGL